MSDDLISRQAAIDVLKAKKDKSAKGDIGCFYNTIIQNTIDAIKDLPSAQPEPSTEIQEILNYHDTTLHPIVSPDNQYVYSELHDMVSMLPSAEPEWNNHTVACLLAEMFGDDCACNFNGIDEWLPEKCEVIDSCPHPVGVACWEQFLKHRSGRRTDE